VESAQTGLAAGFNFAPVGQVAAKALEVFVINFVDAVNAKLVYPAARREAVLATWAARTARRSTRSKATTTLSSAFGSFAIAARAAAEATRTSRSVGSRGGCIGRSASIRYILVFSTHLNLSPSAFNNRLS
jgi:hypothetical protein